MKSAESAALEDLEFMAGTPTAHGQARGMFREPERRWARDKKGVQAQSVLVLMRLNRYGLVNGAGSRIDRLVEIRLMGASGAMTFNTDAATGKDRLCEGKVVVITGGGRGIGRAAIGLLTEAEARVVTCDLDSGSLGEFEHQCTASVDLVQCDLTIIRGVICLARYAGETRGHINALYSN